MTSSGPCSSEEMIRLQGMLDDVSSKSVQSVLNDRYNYGHIIDASLEFQYVALQMKGFCSQFHSKTPIAHDESLLKTHSELSKRIKEKHQKWNQQINQ